MTLDEARALSILGHAPVVLFDRMRNAHIVYWNGIVTTRAHALMMVCEHWFNSYPSTSMQAAAFEELVRCYYLGTFGNMKFDISNFNAGSYMTNIRNLITKSNPNFFKSLVESYSKADALQWFSEKYQEVVDEELHN